MSEQEGSGEVLEHISTQQLLQELSRRLDTSEDPNDRLLVVAIRDYSEVIQASSVTTELNSPEDEFVQAVKAVAILGKFPQGLNFKGEELVAPGVAGAFRVFSPTSFHPNPRHTFKGNLGFVETWFSAIQEYERGRRLMKKHFLAIVSDEQDQGCSLLVYNVHQDQSVRDGGGRHARYANVYFLMPTVKAQEFMQLVKEKRDGADMMERFIQKVAPGVMASKFGEPGIYRVQASELVLLDETFQRNLLVARDSISLKQPNAPIVGQLFLEHADRAVLKQYSQPVGFGTPPAT